MKRLAALLLPALVLAAAITFPPLTGRVVDEAGILSPEQVQRLSAQLETLENNTTDQLVVVTLKSLQGYDIADYGYQLGRHWGIGQRGKDNGVLLIVAPKERKVRIEVGYGLEGVLTDAKSDQIIRNVIVPFFKRGDLAGGIESGAEAIIRVLHSPDAEIGRADKTGSDEDDLPAVIFQVFIFVIIVLSFIPSYKNIWVSTGAGLILGLVVYGASGMLFVSIVVALAAGLFAYFGKSFGGSGGWSGGSGSGGFGGGGFSGGGGSFGGGGASGSW